MFFVLIPASLVIAVDPCHVFHKPLIYFFHHGFSKNQRCQNAGLIATYLGDSVDNYDAVFTGTSFSANFRSDEVEKRIGVFHALKLVLPGARSLENKVMMDKILSYPNVKRIIWEFNPVNFGASENIKELLSYGDFPSYLYNNSRGDDYYYIFNKTTFSYVWEAIYDQDSAYEKVIDDISYWDDGCPSARLCDHVLNSPEDLAEIRASFPLRVRVWRDEAARSQLDFSRIDQWFLPLLLDRCNTDVKFDLYVPPLSYWWFSMQDDYSFDLQLYALRHVVESARSCQNIRVFAFNDVEWIAGDLAHYRDPRHFFGDVHHYLIESMGRGWHIITADNVSAYEQRFIAAVNSYQPWASTLEQMRANARY